MFTSVVLLASLLGLVSAQGGGQQSVVAKTFTSWDCCKPVCANYPTSRPDLVNTRGAAAVCNANNTPLPRQQGLAAQSSCQGGQAFLCSSYQPVPVTEELSYGFAIYVGGSTTPENPACCTCYEAQWLNGAAAGKKMVMQVVNIADAPTPGGDVNAGDLILLTPGGGVGPWNTGCSAQYGLQYAQAWGNDYGGVSRKEDCANLPSELQGGCYWRFNWADGEVNGWNVVYTRVTCPARLTQVSGCIA